MLFSTKQTWRLWCCLLVRPSVVENENYDPNDTNQWPKGPRWPEGLKGPKGPKWTKIYADTKLFFWSDLLWNFVKSTISSIFSYSWDYLKEAVVVAQTLLTCLSCAVRGGGGGGSTLELDNCRSGVRAWRLVNIFRFVKTGKYNTDLQNVLSHLSDSSGRVSDGDCCLCYYKRILTIGLHGASIRYF